MRSFRAWNCVSLHTVGRTEGLAGPTPDGRSGRLAGRAENLSPAPFPRPVVRDPLRSTDVTGYGGSGMGTAVSEDLGEPDGKRPTGGSRS